MMRLTPAGSRTGRRALAPQMIVLLLVLIVLVAAASACSSGAPSPTATPVSKPAEPTKAAGPTTAPVAVTAGALADAGKGVFANKCTGCHGANGQGGVGPANIGSSNALAKYATAKGLYDKVSTTMPKSAPGSLSAAEYLQVTAFLLVQNNFVKASDPLDPAVLATILVK